MSVSIFRNINYLILYVCYFMYFNNMNIKYIEIDLVE